MKREKSLIEHRQTEILIDLYRSPSVQVEELAQKYAVSPVTVRRDLSILESKGFVQRHYGGASLCPRAVQHIRQLGITDNDEYSVYRDRIAQKAASFVEDNDIIFINTSNTAIRMLSYITSRNVTVITNNGNAITTDCPPEVRIFLTGGELRHPRATLVGDYATRVLNSVLAKKAFLGCSGISAENGMTTENANEVNINELMFERVTGETFVLADHTKVGHISNFLSSPLEKISNLITDDHVAPEILEPFRKKGVRIYQVSRPE